MKVFISFFILLFTAASLSYAAPASEPILKPYKESQAYKQYERRPKNELSKLIYVMDRYKGSSYKVVFNNVEYESAEALKYAKSYVAKHYHKENAESWIKDHAYKAPSGDVIYIKDTAGKLTPLRDALVAELKPLTKV